MDSERVPPAHLNLTEPEASRKECVHPVALRRENPQTWDGLQSKHPCHPVSEDFLGIQTALVILQANSGFGSRKCFPQFWHRTRPVSDICAGRYRYEAPQWVHVRRLAALTTRGKSLCGTLGPILSRGILSSGIRRGRRQFWHLTSPVFDMSPRS